MILIPVRRSEGSTATVHAGAEKPCSGSVKTEKGTKLTSPVALPVLEKKATPTERPKPTNTNQTRTNTSQGRAAGAGDSSGGSTKHGAREALLQGELAGEEGLFLLASSCKALSVTVTFAVLRLPRAQAQLE